MKTDWKQVPCSSFSLKGMMSPTEIIDEMKLLGIKKYTYEIRCKNITIKYGMSDAATTRPGERIYRQIGHLLSWGPTRLFGMNGIDFLAIDAEYYDTYQENMNHNDIVIYVWNFDNYPFITIDSWNEINNAEIELIENHATMYGGKPIGNIDDGYMFHKRSAPLLEVWEKFFEVVE